MQDPMFFLTVGVVRWRIPCSPWRTGKSNLAWERRAWPSTSRPIAPPQTRMSSMRISSTRILKVGTRALNLDVILTSFSDLETALSYTSILHPLSLCYVHPLMKYSAFTWHSVKKINPLWLGYINRVIKTEEGGKPVYEIRHAAVQNR